MPFRRGRTVLILLVAVAACAAPVPPAGAAEGILRPDLDQEPPGQITVASAPSQLAQVGAAWLPLGGGKAPRWYLGFSSAVSNVGAGPLVISGHRASTAQPTMTADQLVAGAAGQVVPDVGRLRYTRSPGHQHWHLLGFERYALRRAGSTRAVVTDRKSGFCLGDRYAVGGPRRQGAPPRPVITGRCGLRRTGLLQIQEGISVGYGDVYGAYLEYQDLPVDGLPDGRYVLVHSVNVDGRLHELTRDNDSASVLLDLRWRDGTPTVSQLRVCPDSARSDKPLAANPAVRGRPISGIVAPQSWPARSPRW